METSRDGLLARLETDAGLTGLGEASPVASFGGGTVAAAERLLAGLAPSLAGCPVSDVTARLASLLPSAADTAAVRCALDVAAGDVLARSRGLPLAALLGTYHPTVPVNATLGGAAGDELVAAVRAAAGAGFTCFKLKVGVMPSLAAEIERIALVRELIGPAASLRLDANGAWDADRALELIRAAAAFDLEYVEQPVPARDLAGLARVRASSPVAIAADEAVSDLERARAVLAAGAADVLIVKPMVCGGLHAGRRIVELARDAGVEAVVTSTVESGIGVAAALHLAATLPQPARACGLATAGLLARDLIDPPLPLADGVMTLPDGPGLGVTPAG